MFLAETLTEEQACVLRVIRLQFLPRRDFLLTEMKAQQHDCH